MTALALDYVYSPRARPAARGRQVICDMFAASTPNMRQAISALRPICNVVSAIPDTTESPTEPYWSNGWFPGLDALSMISMFITHKPKTYVEIGSGNSTKFARWASNYLDLNTRIISIDPEPRAEIASLCDVAIREACEDADLSFIDDLVSGDIVFADNSHRCFANSDVTTFFTDILPRLRTGVVWGLHDIWTPRDYPQVFVERGYTEQYLLEAYLLGGAGGDGLLWGTSYIIHEQASLLDPIRHLLSSRPLIEPFGGCVWLQKHTRLQSSELRSSRPLDPLS